MSLTSFESGSMPNSSSDFLSPSQHVERLVNAPLIPMAGLILLFFAAFGNLVNVAIDKDVVAVDKQVIAKLGVLALAGLYGAYGFMTEAKVRRLLFTLPTMWVVIIFGFYFGRSSIGNSNGITCLSDFHWLCAFDVRNVSGASWNQTGSRRNLLGDQPVYCSFLGRLFSRSRHWCF